MRAPAGVAAIEVYLPGRLTAARMLPEVADLDPAQARSCLGLGIDTVLDASGFDAEDLAVGAVQRLLHTTDCDPDSVNALLLMESRAPDRLLVSAATRVQHESGLCRAVSLSVGGLGCVASSLALALARSLLLTNPGWSNIVLAYGSRPATTRRYRHPVTIIGDGGVAVLVTRDGHARLVDSEQQTNGEYWDLFGVDFRYRSPEDWQVTCRDPQLYSFQLALESRNRFRELNERLLARNALDMSDIQHVIIQNLSLGAVRFHERTLKARIALCCLDNLQTYGHLGAMDVLLNLRTGLDSGDFRSGDLVLLMNNSPVAAWSSTLIQL
jgi:3-oxoacyl-[acyl-carrier-protein] synthase-3